MAWEQYKRVIEANKTFEASLEIKPFDGVAVAKALEKVIKAGETASTKKDPIKLAKFSLERVQLAHQAAVEAPDDDLADKLAEQALDLTNSLSILEAEAEDQTEATDTSDADMSDKKDH